MRDDRRNDEPRINHRIRVPQVRVIGPDGEQLGVMPTDVAKRKAELMGVDLVEIQPKAKPPVCKIMDYGKFKYERKKKENENRKSQKKVEVKEIKFRPGTDTHDFETKMRKIRAFIEEGNRVKVTVMFRGRELAHRNLGVELCSKIKDELSEVAHIEGRIAPEGRSVFMLLVPGKAKPQSDKRNS